MKIFTQGCMEKYCQLPRINDAFRQLGHEIIDDPIEADLVYCNNAWYDDLIKEEVYKKITGVIVFNVLDLAPHIIDFPLQKLKDQLRHADVITTISKTVRADLFKRTGYVSSVIYQPIQNITYTREKKHPFKYLFCGRVRDPNKRAALGVQALLLNKVPASEVLTCGSEILGYGAYAGIQDEKILNEIFNSVDYLIFPSKEEGIGLPIIEAMAAGVIPIVCNDLSTRMEFIPIKDYDNVEPNAESIAKFIRNLEDNPANKNDLRLTAHIYYKALLEDLFQPLNVAKQILKVAKVENNIKARR